MNEGAIVTREQDVLRWALEREIVAPIDDPQDFYRHAHVVTWSAIQRLKDEGKATDYLTVRAELERRGQLETVDPVYLLELSRDSVRPSEAAILTASEELKAASRNRRLRALLGRHATAEQIDLTQLTTELGALEARDSTPLLLDDSAVLNQPEPQFIVGGVLPERGLVALVGPSGVGKTFLAIDAAMSIAADRAWLGSRIVKSGPVVYVAAEGAPGPRIGGWKLAHHYPLEVPVGLHTWSGPVALLDPLAVATFIAAIKLLKPVAVILDTLARCFVGGDENSARDVGVAVSSMDRIRTAVDATVIVLHHMNKGGSSERGSGALRGACDAVLYLQKADDLLQVTCDKQKDAEPFQPINIRLTPAYPGAATCVIRLASEVLADEELTDSQGKALHALTELFGELGATPAEWEAAIPAMHRATYYRARAVLTAKGYVRQDEQKRRFYPTGKRPVASNRAACRTTTAHSSQAVA